MPKKPIIELNDVHKSFNSIHVIKGLNMQVYPGELVTLLGVNGAGKTTTINMMLGLEQATSGHIELFGKKPGDMAVRGLVGVTPQSSGFPENIKVREIIEFLQAHYQQTVPIDTLSEQFGLLDILERKVTALSGGQQRRLAVAQAFVGKPKCVFLDEPTTGLDVGSRQQIWNAIRTYLAAGGTLFLTTHYLEEAEALSTRIIILEDGKVKTEGTVSEIKAMSGMARVRFNAVEVPDDLVNVDKLERSGNTFTLHSNNTDALLRELVQREVAFEHLQIVESSLESAFMNMTLQEGGA